jgi:glycopeptide antibiotics resistance protein
MRTKRFRILFAVTVVVVAGILLWPQHVDGAIADFICSLAIPIEQRVVIYTAFEALGNVALFVPVGLFASLWLSRRWVAVLTGFAMSAVFETVQLALPGRTASLWDVLWNTIGASIGVLIGWTWDVFRERRCSCASVGNK